MASLNLEFRMPRSRNTSQRNVSSDFRLAWATGMETTRPSDCNQLALASRLASPEFEIESTSEEPGVQGQKGTSRHTRPSKIEVGPHREDEEGGPDGRSGSGVLGQRTVDGTGT